MIDIKTGKEIENPAVLKAPLAGSANASVRGMMRGVGARNAAMFGGGWDNRNNWVYCSGGSFYLDTGIIPLRSWIVEYDVKLVYQGENKNFSGTNVIEQGGMCLNTWRNIYEIETYTYAGWSRDTFSQYGERCLIRYASDGWSVNGDVFNDKENIGSNKTLVLFDRNRDGSPAGLSAKSYVYGLKITDNNGVVRLNYRPFVDNGVVGFRDVANGNMFVTTSFGTLTFGTDS